MLFDFCSLLLFLWLISYFWLIVLIDEDDDSVMKVKISLSKKGSNVIEEIIDEKEDEDEELNDEDHNNDMEDNFLKL